MLIQNSGRVTENSDQVTESAFTEEEKTQLSKVGQFIRRVISNITLKINSKKEINELPDVKYDFDSFNYVKSKLLLNNQSKMQSIMKITMKLRSNMIPI